jgi:hypothetical protein
MGKRPTQNAAKPRSAATNMFRLFGSEIHMYFNHTEMYGLNQQIFLKDH